MCAQERERGLLLTEADGFFHGGGELRGEDFVGFVFGEIEAVEAEVGSVSVHLFWVSEGKRGGGGWVFTKYAI